MNIAPERQSGPLRADLSAATPALARIAARCPELNARIDSIYLLMTRSTIKQTARSTAGLCDRTAPRSKSP
jgi:hypothetical protein